MYTRSITLDVPSDKVEELMRLYRDSLERAGRQQKGFVGASIAVEPSTGESLVQLYWKTKADMLAGEASGRILEQVAKAAPLLAAPLTLDHYAVGTPQA